MSHSPELPSTVEDEVIIDPSTLPNNMPVELVGSGTFNLNPLLANNILNSEYYLQLQLYDFNECVERARNTVKNVEPFIVGRGTTPSTAFCILYRLFHLNVTVEQLRSMLDDEAFPLVRAIGALFVRYACHPQHYWFWLGPYITDDEPFTPYVYTPPTTMKRFIVRLLQEPYKYRTTVLPRIPITVQKILDGKIETAQAAFSAACNFASKLRVGDRLEAQYQVDGKMKWFPCRFVREGPKKQRITVTFDGYSDDEEISCAFIRPLPRPLSSRTNDTAPSSKARSTRSPSSRRSHDRYRSPTRDRYRSHSRDRYSRDKRDRSRSRSRDRYTREYRDRSRSRDRYRDSHSRRRSSRSRSRDRKDNPRSGRDRSRDRYARRSPPHSYRTRSPSPVSRRPMHSRSRSRSRDRNHSYRRSSDRYVRRSRDRDLDTNRRVSPSRRHDRDGDRGSRDRGERRDYRRW